MAVAGAYVPAEELAACGTIDAALERYEQRLRPAIDRQQRAARRIAKWFVPRDALHLLLRDIATRASTWPPLAALLRQRMAAQSIFFHR
jgi:2-polyprenyl-6-methoxyphenol hydroxylase-like FAD-dependent oxidoreductase